MNADTAESTRVERRRQERLSAFTPDHSFSHELSTRYNRLIKFLKYALPLTAAGLVVLLIAWPRFVNYEPGFTLSASDIEAVEDDLHMEKLRFSGRDIKGHPFVISAASASQHGPKDSEMLFEAIVADINLKAGAWYSLAASSGRFDRESKKLLLEGRVSIFSDSGYEVRAQRVLVDFNKSHAVSREPVTAQGPLGTLSARFFEVDIGDKRIIFSEGVKMTLYTETGS